MKSSTAYNHYTRFKRYIADIYQQARIYGSPHAKIIERKEELVFKDPAWEKCPGWVHDKIREVDLCKLEETYNYLIWAFPSSDGSIKRYSDLSKEEQRNPNLVGHHYWLREEWFENGSVVKIEGNTLIKKWEITDKKFS